MIPQTELALWGPRLVLRIGDPGVDFGSVAVASRCFPSVASLWRRFRLRRRCLLPVCFADFSKPCEKLASKLLSNNRRGGGGAKRGPRGAMLFKFPLPVWRSMPV